MLRRWLVGALLLVTVSLVSTNIRHANRYNGIMLQRLHDSLFELEMTLMDAKEVPIENRGWMLKQSRLHAYHAIDVMYQLYPELVNDELRGNPMFLFHPDTEYSIATDEELDSKRRAVYDFATPYSQVMVAHGTDVG